MDFFYKSYGIVFLPICNAFLEIITLIKENFISLAKHVALLVSIFIGVSSLGYYHLALRSLTWILLGVASSIGFGFGMHTFVLFLAPHIAAVTMAAHSCNSLDFPEPPYPNEIICPNDANYLKEITFFSILSKVWLESFMWGLGTAIGEMPPYLAARLRARAMGHGHGGDGDTDLRDFEKTASWETWMIKIINKVGFIGILLCAAVPNPLFDAAGVASGMAQIPFLSFFSATLIGKAVIKVLLQSSFVILSFHKNNLETLIHQLDNKLAQYIPATKDLNIYGSLTGFLETQRNNVLTKKVGQEKQYSLFQTLFNWIICICFVLFFISLINALDGQYRQRKAQSRRKKD